MSVCVLRGAVLLAGAALLGPLAATARAQTVPVDVGVGPAAYFITGPVQDDQAVHTGLKLSVQAILDQATIRANAGRIPPQIRRMAESMSEVRTSPSILIPDAIVISPPRAPADASLYGVTWRPVSIGVPFGAGGPVRLEAAAGLLVSYMYLHSTALPTTHFLRPGLDLGAELEVALTRSFLVSAGWSSGLYVPQKIGSFAIGARDESIWHVGQAFLKLHVRFPYTMR